MFKQFNYIRLLLSAVLLAATPLLLSAQWSLINDRITSFDMLTTRVGLASISLNFQQVLARYDNGVVTGYTNTTDQVTSIVIRDTNVAYLSVRNDGIYKASNHWKDLEKITDAARSVVLCVHSNLIVAWADGKLIYSPDGALFFPSNGIDPADSVYAVEAYSSKTLLAAADSVLYRSLNGGATWTKVLDTLKKTRSIYLDRSRNIFYIGGKTLLRSLDSGWHWEPLTSIFFDPLSGPVLGARDCSGAFYLGPDGAVHGELYRSINQGKFFQNVGPAYVASTRLRKAVVLDRGSTFFWLDESNLWSVSHIGVDSAVVDLVKDRVLVTVDTPIHSSLCQNAPLGFGSFSISYDQCTGIILDSLIPIEFNPAFSVSFAPRLLRDTTITFSVAFKAKRVGPDSATYRIRFHSPTTQNVENLFITLHGFGETSGAFLSLPKNSIEFGTVGVDSIRKRTLTFSNTGCDTLWIDSILTSSIPAFAIDLKNYPIALLEGKEYSFEIRFTPHAEGEYLEAITLATSVGTRYITLHGMASQNGKPDTTLSVVTDGQLPLVAIYPNPAHSVLFISGFSIATLTDIKLIDELGRNYLPVITRQNNNDLTLDLSQIPAGRYLLISNSAGIRQRVIRY